MAVTVVTEDQQPDASQNLVDVYVITFTIPGHAGTFVVTVPQAGDAAAAAAAAVAAKTAEVEAIYAG